VRLLANPLILRASLVLLLAAAGFALVWILIRHLRESLAEENNFSGPLPNQDTFPAQTFSAVIQHLKQQKHELEAGQQAERRRARTSENISAAVLSNLQCGVIFFGPNGLVRHANPAARRMLGCHSPSGMSAAELFRDARTYDTHSEPRSLGQVIEQAFRERTPFSNAEAHYSTPAGEHRVLDVTMTLVRGGGELMGCACLINDQTEIARFRQDEHLRGELSSEMALKLRSSLATISGYAQQLAAARDPDLARQVAADIAHEAAHLDHTIGGFLLPGKPVSVAMEGK
jgi:PAS domain-containing protein